MFKNYPTYRTGEGFPANLCISLNECVVHGIADDTPIRDGDIVGIDCGVEVNGWCGDSATTVLVGNVRAATRKLCTVCLANRDWDRALKYHLCVLHSSKVRGNLNEFVYISDNTYTKEEILKML